MNGLKKWMVVLMTGVTLMGNVIGMGTTVIASKNETQESLSGVDVYMPENGSLERVIRVYEDGSFVTEPINDIRTYATNTPSHMEDIAGEVEKIGNIIASDIETYLRKKEIIDIFDAFLGTLSERDRDIFVRRYWYMDSIKRIADRHNCGESRIKSILARSRKKLYYLLTEAGYAE